MLRKPLLMLMSLLMYGAVAQPAAATGPQGWWITLTWTPEYCDQRPGSREPQCRQEHYFTFIGLRQLVHGAKPEPCKADEPSKALLERLMVSIPNRQIAKKLWTDYAACSGLTADDYVLQLERAQRRVQVPAQYDSAWEIRYTSAAAVRAAFIEANPELLPGAISLSCNGEWLSEVRVCVDRDFAYQACGVELAERCGAEVKMRTIRRSQAERGPG